MMAPASKKRPLVFLVVGMGNTLFDFVFYTVLTLTILKYSIAIAGLVSGTIALIIAFITHSFITWRGREVSKRTILKFVGFTGFGMWIIRPSLLALFIRFNWLYDAVYTISKNLGLPFSHNFIASTGAFGFMIVIVLAYNYFVYERFVFTITPNLAHHIEPESH